MSNFLETEYKECLSLIKYYDERQQSLIKFGAALSSAIPSILFGIYGLKDMNMATFWYFSFLISTVASISLLVIFLVMVQNRLYFIYPARQVNAIRAHLLMEIQDFKTNQMYLSTNFSAFKLLSTHTLLNIFTCLQMGGFIGVGIFSFSINNNQPNLRELVISSCVIGCFAALIVFLISSIYLHKASKYHPDRSIHYKKI